MKRVEVRDYQDQDTGQQLRALFIDNKVFDWNIDIAEIEKAYQACKGEEACRAIHANIQNHFLQCFEIFMGKKYKLSEINEAIERGYIDDKMQ